MNKKYKTGALPTGELTKPSLNARVGIAFDIGTTTIAAGLVDLSSGETLSALSAPNPQSKWGADVISRITAISKDPKVLPEISRAVVEACNGLTHALTGGRSSLVREISAAGNSVMEHILLNISPEPLARVPYKPAFKEARRLAARDVGFDAGDGALFYAFPLIGAFVGGDAVAAALSLGLNKTAKTALLIDIGTNSEIILCVGGTLYAASAAAGPAFEGGGVKCGMTAQNGAIKGVRITGDSLALDVIGSVGARGICGSGLIEAVSELIKAGLIEKTGRIKNAGEVHTNLSSKIKEAPEGNAVVLSKGPAGEITLSQGDVRSLQTAKAAIRAGIAILLKKADVSAAEVEAVYLAGAFGSNINPTALETIGLLEKDWNGRVRFMGDAALEGAALCLGSEEKKKEAEETAAKAKYVSLSGSANFEREFIRSMNF
ncbi:MAG: DUF4445 domain-containing protein [Deltaproteobacteria bacterium]|nr:DUF4445 domain-containing protein [Deltaproteobacteria bacterium]